MPELSKTARASTVKEVQERKVETTDEAIAALRLDRQAHIWPNCERIDKLLVAYDAAIAENAKLTDSLNAQSDYAVLKTENVRLVEYIAELRVRLVEQKATLLKLLDEAGVASVVSERHQKTVRQIMEEEEINAGATEN